MRKKKIKDEQLSKEEMQDLKDNIKSSKEDLRAKSKDYLEVCSELEKEFRAEHGEELRILRQIESEVGNAFESVILEAGLQDAQFDLEHLYIHFKVGVQKFCSETDGVYRKFLHAGNNLSPQQSITQLQLFHQPAT